MYLVMRYHSLQNPCFQCGIRGRVTTGTDRTKLATVGTFSEAREPPTSKMSASTEKKEFFFEDNSMPEQIQHQMEKKLTGNKHGVPEGEWET